MTQRHLGHTARKRFGQNFLVDNHIIDQIIGAIAPEPEQCLLEIGPGLGALTEAVLDQIDHLTVIELDRDLAQRLKTHPFIGSKLTVIQEDALEIDFSELSSSDPETPLRWRVFGNLPYNISTPLIFHLLGYRAHIQDMYFMLQKEVVKRMAAQPGSRTYGRLSIMCQLLCDVDYLFDVPPESFQPPPKVDSAIVCLRPLLQPRVDVADLSLFKQIVVSSFSQKRKTLKNNLKALFVERYSEGEHDPMGHLDNCLTATQIPTGARAETLELTDFAKLTEWMTENDD